MRFTKALVFAGVLCAAMWAAAQAPVIQSTSPRKFVVERNNTFHSIDLNGTNLARRDTNGYTFDKDVQVFVRSSLGGDFQKARITGWNSSKLTVSLEASQWMMKPQTLYFKVAVREMGESNQFALPIEAFSGAAPHIKNLSNGLVPVLSAIRNDNDRIIRVVAENLTNQSSVTVGGSNCSIAWANFGDGVIDCWVAKEKQSAPGVYDVQVVDPSGKSNVVQLTVLAPPAIEKVTPEALGVASAATPVQVRYASGESPTVMVRAGASDWKSVGSSAAGNGMLNVNIPPEFLGRPQTVEMKLKNRVGESAVARIPVELKNLKLSTTTMQTLRPATIATPQIQKPPVVKTVPPR